jgi:hypothetical protein
MGKMSKPQDTTVRELVAELLKFDQDAIVRVHCSGCCPYAHDVVEVRAGDLANRWDECGVVIEV